jgi:hypothetical protein
MDADARLFMRLQLASGIKKRTHKSAFFCLPCRLARFRGAYLRPSLIGQSDLFKLGHDSERRAEIIRR